MKFQHPPVPRLALILAERSSGSNRDQIIRRFLPFYDGSDVEILRAVDSHELSGEPVDSNSWKRSLERISAAYRQGRIESPYDLQHLASRKLPLEPAKELLSQADRYPIAMVRAAESRLRDALTQRIVPVAEAARKGDWFDS